MALPDPVPDNPLKWSGWKSYLSPNPYERLCLDFTTSPTQEQIEEHWRKLLVWWQKKLPLKNQPSNPMAQLLRIGLDDAPVKLTEARTWLLDPEKRAEVDAGLLDTARESAMEEFKKYLSFAISSGILYPDEEISLFNTGGQLGLAREAMEKIIDETLAEKGVQRLERQLPVAFDAPVAGTASTDVAPPMAAAVSTGRPEEEFMRMLWLSGIDEITDDQRDAFCNMGEALGLTGGEAEDVIDEYLEARMRGVSAPPKVTTSVSRPRPVASVAAETVSKPAAPAPTPAPVPAARRVAPVAKVFVSSPLQRAEEKAKHPPFTNSIGTPMLLVHSGTFRMGSHESGAAANEQPLTPTNVSAFYMARWPVTNAQYELFDPGHLAKRAPWADDLHPAVYISAAEAGRFCEWLSRHEKRRYRLPTEAEWEYAARGLDGRTFPWGERLTGGYANFADASTRFPWAEPGINDGYAESSPVGVYPAGASPFGIEDMAGNVSEWCLDCMVPYPGKERTNPRGPTEGLKRNCRGGSWKSRATALRASARAFYMPNTSANDIGFRIICEIPQSGG